MQVEFGSSMPIRFITRVTAYDSKGEEITIPKCEKCDEFKIQVIGRNFFIWVCNNCAFEESKYTEDIYGEGQVDQGSD